MPYERGRTAGARGRAGPDVGGPAPGEQVPFPDYLARALRSDAQIAALFGSGETFVVSVDGRPVEGLDSTLPVTADSRVVLYRRQGPALDVLTRGVVRRICLN